MGAKGICLDAPDARCQKSRFALYCAVGDSTETMSDEAVSDLNRSRGEGGAICTTHWSVVLQAGGEFSPQAQAALNSLCETYWYPLYVFVRRQGHAPADAAAKLGMSDGAFRWSERTGTPRAGTAAASGNLSAKRPGSREETKLRFLVTGGRAFCRYG